jgi:TatD DNase family protein
MIFFDAHCHLQDHRFGSSLVDVLDRAQQAGVRFQAVKGTREADWNRVGVLAKTERGVHPSFGLHPWFLKHKTEQALERLVDFLDTFTLSGVGEIGIDPSPKGEESVPMESQEALFLAQLKIAKERERVVSIHCRSGWDRLFSVLDRVGELPGGVMIHCFGGSIEVAQELLDRGAYLSFSGTITRLNNRRAAEVIPVVPLDRMLFETDAPDLLPQGIEGPLNEPAYLPYIIEQAAQWRSESIEQLVRATTANAHRLFFKKDALM